MPNPSASNFPAEQVSWNDVVRVCRRICVLRETGQSAEAARLQSGSLPEMIAALRTPADSDDSLAQRRDAILAAEAERVADAAVLAELLAPMLHRAAPSAPVAPIVAPAPMAPAPRARPTPADIADFIDEMIAQERTRPGDGRPQRRAS